MKIIIKFGIFACLLTIFGCVNNKIEKKCISHVESFFTDIHDKKSDDALLKLLKTNSHINLNDSTSIKLIDRFNYINNNSGKFIDGKLLLSRKIYDDILTYSYLVKYEKNFYRFIFSFYNTKNEPVLYSITIDENIDDELRESLSLYFNYEL